MATWNVMIDETVWWRSFLLLFSQNLALTPLTNGSKAHTKTCWRCKSCHIPQKKDQYLLSFMTTQNSGYETEMLRCSVSANKSYVKQCRGKKNPLGRCSRLILTCQWDDAWDRLYISVITVPKEVEISSCSCASIKSELGGWSSFDHSVNSLLFSLVFTCTHLSIYYHSQVTATVRTETWKSDCWHQMNHPASWKNMLAFLQY